MSSQIKLTNQNEESQNCPLCEQKFDLGDLSFLPCACGYRVCVFCWNGIKSQEGGACPSCRTPYEEEPVHFAPPPPTDYRKIREEEKAQRDEKREQKRIEEISTKLADTRIVQRNLIFVSGMSLEVKDSEDLKKPEYFGKYGEIKSVTLLKTPTQESKKTSVLQRANLEFARIEDAVKSIKLINSSQEQFGKSVKASLGTTRYCDQFVKGLTCTRRVCTLLHEPANADDCLSKDDLNKKLMTFQKSLCAKYYRVIRPAAAAKGAKPSTTDSNVGSNGEQSPGQSHKKGQNKNKSKTNKKTSDNEQQEGQGRKNNVGGGVSKRKEKKGKTDYNFTD